MGPGGSQLGINGGPVNSTLELKYSPTAGHVSVVVETNTECRDLRFFELLQKCLGVLAECIRDTIRELARNSFHVVRMSA